MFSFFNKENEGEISLIIDIQSGLIRSALALNKKNESVKILYTISKLIPHKSHLNSSYTIKVMLKTLSEIIKIISKEGIIRIKSLGYNIKHIKKIHYILSSPWVLSESKSLKLDFKKSTEITYDIVQNLVEEERKNVEKKFKESKFNSNLSTIDSDLVFIEQKIFEIKLNGYKVNSYNGKKAENLEISFASTLSSNKLLEKINSIVQTVLHSRPEIVYHSALLLNFLAMRNLVPEKDNFIAIHIHSGLTDIVVVKNGLSSILSSFPYGTETLLRKISYQIRQNIETTESMLTLFDEDKLDSHQKERMDKIIEPLTQNWYLNYIKSVDHEDDNLFLPKTIYISAHSYVNLFKDIIKKNNANIKIILFDITAKDINVIFEKNSEYNLLIAMYAFVLNSICENDKCE